MFVCLVFYCFILILMLFSEDMEMHIREIVRRLDSDLSMTVCDEPSLNRFLYHDRVVVPHARTILLHHALMFRAINMFNAMLDHTDLYTFTERIYEFRIGL